MLRGEATQTGAKKGAGRKAYDIFRSENIDVPAQNRPKFRAYPNFVKQCNKE